MAAPIVNPPLPYVGDIPGELIPGKMIRIQGVTQPDGDRFNINLQTGPSSSPKDNTALHVSVRLKQGYVARNTYEDGCWGNEQGSGSLPIGFGESFEILILVDPSHYKVAVNGQHFCEFPHKIPFNRVSHLLIDGDVVITLLSFEGVVPVGGDEAMAQTAPLNAAGPQGVPPPQYGPPPGAYGPPPGYGGPQGYGPPPPGGDQQSGFSSFLDQAQEALVGAIKTAATEKIINSVLSPGGGQQQQQPQGYAPQNAQYGQYPMPPQQQEQRGPMESLLSGLLSGGGGQQAQPHQQPQQDLGSNVGGLLSSLAGSLFQGSRDQQH